VLQSEIAEAVDVTVTAYSRWEGGKRVPQEDDIERLAKYFGVTPAYLRYGISPRVETQEELRARINPANAHRMTEEELDHDEQVVAAKHHAAKLAAKKPPKKRKAG
jgi:transcriptional regulator with XRE-family HTH domain